MFRTLALSAAVLASPAFAQTAAPAVAPAPVDPAPVEAPLSIAPVPGDSIEKTIYACAGNETMQVVFVNTAGGSSWAVLLDQDEMIPMQVTTSASGAIYKAISPDYTYELLTKGDTAELRGTTEGKEEVLKTDCSA